MENSGKKNLTIGILVDYIRDNYHYKLLEGIMEEAARSQFNLLVFFGKHIKPQENVVKSYGVIYDLIDNKVVDYLIFFPGIFDNASEREIAAFLEKLVSIPLVIIGYQFKDYPCVILDNKTGFKILITHLIIKHNRKKLVFIKGIDGTYDSDSRLEAFKETLTEHGLPVYEELIFPGFFVEESGQAAMKQLLDIKQFKPGLDFDAVVCVNDSTAIGVMEFLLERKVNIPDDVAIVGFDDWDSGKTLAFPLSTVKQVTRKLGREAVHCIKENFKDHRKHIIQAQVVIRRSCGCHRQIVEYSESMNWDFNAEIVGKRLQKERDNLIVQVEEVISFNSSQEKTRAVSSRFVDSFILFSADEKGNSFLEEFDAVLSTVLIYQEDLALWDYALIILRKWLMHFSPDNKLPDLYKSILDQASDLIRITIKENNIRTYIEYEYYSDILRGIEDHIKHNLEMEPFLKAIADHLTWVKFKHYWFFLYKTAGQYKRDFSLILSCTNCLRNQIETAGSVFPEFRDITDKLLMQYEPFIFFILPVAFEESKYGFFIINLCSHVFGRITYDTISSLLGSTMKTIKLMEEVKEAYRQLARAHRELELSHKSLEAAQYSLRREMQAARTIQTALLPQDLSHEELDMAGHMLTAIEVGGDYYDFIRSGKQDWIVIGDVSGHGVHAGLIMMMVQTSLHLILREKPDISIPELLAAIDSVISDNIKRLGECHYMSIVILRYEGQGRFVYSGMHLPLLIYRRKGGHVEIIPTKGMWLGVSDDISEINKEESFILEKGDCLFLYTDGLTEAEKEDSVFRMYGDRNLFTLLSQVGKQSAREIVHAVLTSLEGYRIVDDVTVFAVKRI